MKQTDRAGAFAGGVVALLGTQVFGAGMGIINGILIARLLGPAAKGDYYILVLLPTTAMVLLQLGLPQAFGFFAARGQTAGILTKTLILAAALSLVAFFGVSAVIPLIRDAALGDIDPKLIVVAFLALPLALHATFTTAIVMGRQAVRWYSTVNIVVSGATTLLLIGVFAIFGPSVSSALAVFVMTVAIQSVGFAVSARRVSRVRGHAEGFAYRKVFGYGLKLYPSSLAGFFSNRVDAYLIAFLIADASAPLGYYSMAVGLAEMVFFLPRAVSTLFFPHVAASPREESDRQVAFVSRVTLLVTAVFAVLLVPAAGIMIWLVLPAFIPSFLPLVVLLPGVVALAVANVVGSYMRGIDRPGLTSYINLIALVLNVVINLVLIPLYGIVGAAAASLVSYSLTALLMTAFAAPLTRNRIIDFWMPRASDARYVVGAASDVLRRFAPRSRPISDGGGQ